jgi:Fe-S cluster assembly protein SufD
MKLLVDKNNLIILDKENIINEYDLKIESNQIIIDKEDDIFIYINDLLSQKPIEIRVKNDVKSKLFIVVTNSRTNVIKINFLLENNSELELVSYFSAKNKAKLDFSRSFTLEKFSNLKLFNFLTYNGTLNIDETINMIGEGANTKLEFLNLGKLSNVTNVLQEINHLAIKTKSMISNSLIASNKSKLNYQVIGSIAKGMEYSDCSQSNRGIILGEESEIAVEPTLLIDEYNVSASHGAAIGQIDENQLYYLKSRGLNEEEARSLIIFGLTNPFIEKITDQGLKSLFKRQVNRIV